MSGIKRQVGHGKNGAVPKKIGQPERGHGWGAKKLAEAAAQLPKKRRSRYIGRGRKLHPTATPGGDRGARYGKQMQRGKIPGEDQIRDPAAEQKLGHEGAGDRGHRTEKIGDLERASPSQLGRSPAQALEEKELADRVHHPEDEA